ncbi:MAG: CxxxxCH/CxxCH domain-containing protein, partial [Deltaproteobacteria bacterium]
GNTTTVGNGTNPGNATLAPGAGATNLDAFTLQTSTGTDTVTAATVTLGVANSFNNIALVEITNAAGSTVYGSVSNPAAVSIPITLTTNITATTTLTTYYVRITPKSHAAMPAVPGASYATTGTVTAITSTNAKTYSDTASATLTIDNASTANPTAFSGTAGNGNVNLIWTNPADADFNQVVVVRRTAAIADVPTEGATYTAGGAMGASSVVYVGNLATFNDTTVVNGTGYYYKIWAKDSNGNYSSGGTAAGPYTPTGPVTTVGNGTNPGPAFLKPGDPITSLDAFTLQTSTGTENVTAVTLLLTGGGAPNAFSGIAQIAITNNAGTTTYGTLNNPASDTPTVTLTTNITATTTATQYLVRITPKSHVNMPSPPGDLYTISGTVTGITSTNTKVYSDTASATIEVDNASTDVCTWGVITPGNTQVDLSWANPLDPDLDGTNSVVVLRKAGSAVTEVPVEGVSYAVGNTIGGATVRYVGAVEGFVDTGLTNFTDYYYAIFAKDTNGNYSSAATTGPHQPWVPVCVHNTPTLTITPAARSAIPTDVAKYTVSVKNNDNALCTTEDFTLSLTDSNGTDFTLPSTLSAPVLSLAPGQTKQSFLTVAVKGTATLGNQNLTTIDVAGPVGHTAPAPASVSVTTTAANPLMHNSKTTSSTKWGAAGWGISGGRYGTFNCYICHEESVVGADGTANVKKIRTTITMPADAGVETWPNGAKTTAAITFSDTRAGSADYNDPNGAHATSSRICEVCHTYQGGGEPNNSGVRFHAYNMSGATADEQNHNNQGNCLSCHPHEGGFKAQGCTACHGYPINTLADRAVSPATGSTTIGAHVKHQTEGFDCDYCHGPGSSSSGGGAQHGSGKIAIDFDGGALFALVDTSDGTYNGHAEVTAGYVGNDAGAVNGTRGCVNIYCHGGTIYPGLADPNWTGAVACGACHNDTSADTGWLGSHADHISATGANLNCNVCHGAGYSAGTLKPANHLNGKVKIDLGSYGTYSKGANGSEHVTQGLTGAAAYGSCTVSCHGSTATPNWGSVDFGTYPAKCVKCHNDGTAGTALVNAVPVASKNVHVVHVSSPATNYATNQCEACHGANAHNGTHANHYTDGAYPNGTATYANSLSGYSAANKNCTNTCHASTTTNLWVATPPALACLDCHSGSYIGGNNVAKGFNATPATGLHAMTAAGVQKHDNTLTDGNAGNGTGCGECHVTEPATHIDGLFTADGAGNGDRWVSTGAGGRANMTYAQIAPASGNSGTCNGTGVGGSCHSDGGNWYRRWSTEANQADTVTAVGSAKCNVCHGQWNSWAQGTTHYKAGSSAASTKGSGHDGANDCANCHAYLHASYGSNHDSTPTKTITMNSNGATYARNGSTYGTSKAGCSACHGGAGNGSYDFDISYFGANTVIGTAIPMPACNSCHDNAGKAATVPQVRIGTTANSSSPHVDADGPGGATYTINVATPTAKCENCHSGHASGTTGAGDVEIPTNSTVLGTTVPTMNWSYSTHGSKIQLGNTNATDRATTMSATATTEAEMCWGCHDNATVGVSEWGTNDNAKTRPAGGYIFDYGDLYTDLTTVPGTKQSNWVTGKWRSGKGRHSNSGTNPFWYKRGSIQSTHSVNFDSGTTALTTTGNSLGFGRRENVDTVANIRCTWCHDVHGTHNGVNNDTSGGTGTADQPYLRGTWIGNPYPEDGAPQLQMRDWSVQGGTSTWYGKVPRASALNSNTGLTAVTQAGGWWIDQNSNHPNSTTNVQASSGLCAQCHGAAKTGTWNTSATLAQNDLYNLNWNTNGTGEANIWVSGYNGHANSVINGPGRGTAASAESYGRNIFTRTKRGTNRAAIGTDGSLSRDMGMQTETAAEPGAYRASTSDYTTWAWYPRVANNTYNGTTQARITAYRAFAWGTPAVTASTRTSIWATGSQALTQSTAATEPGSFDAQANYHNFTCSKCHNPHASRLPKLMITNCLDTNHNTWEDDTLYTGGALGAPWANKRHAQWANAQNCHRLDANASQTSAAATVLMGRGWNRVTPWLEYTNPNSTRTTLDRQVAPQ